MSSDSKISKTSAMIVMASLAAIVSACGVGEASPGPDALNQANATPLPVEVIQPRKADIFATYHATTTLTSDADAPVAARVGGEVTEIFVEEGDRVVQGQVLARLDGERLKLEMEQAKANLEKTSREYQRYINLHERGLVSSAAFEDMQFELDGLRATYELKRLNYEYTYIRAPIAGVVAAREIKLGQHLNAQETTFRVTDTSQLVAHLKIPQTELARITAGDDAEIRVDALPDDVFVATIARISPTIDLRNGTFRATAYVDNTAGLLAPGMFGRFDIAYERHENALTIPVDAVLDEDNESVVYVVSDGAAERRAVKTGIVDGGVVEILSGIEEEDRIVVTGQSSLRDGSRVLASVPNNAPVTG